MTNQGFAGWTQAGQAYMDEAMKNVQRMAGLSKMWEKSQAVKKGATPSDVVYQEDRVKLLHYKSDRESAYKTPMLFVFALVNRPYILDILPHKSVVRHFVDAGFDTYMIDWGAPKHSDRFQNLDTYINGYMKNIVDFLAERSEARTVNVLGYCMGGAMSAMYTALRPEKVQTLMMLAAGIDFSTREGLLNLWADEANFDVDKFVDAHGNCPAEYLQASFLLLKPVQNFIQKNISLFERADDEAFLEEFLTMETWLNDNIPISGELYREYVKYLYQQNLMVQNKLPVGKHIVNLKNITCPVLNLMASADDLVPCAQSEPFNDLVGSHDRKAIKFKAGHIGLAVGSRAHRELWPEAVKWLAERSDVR